MLLAEVADVIAAYLESRFGHTDFVEDCVQESLMSLHKARHTYDPTRSFRAWMFAIVRHRAIDMLRRRDTYRGVVAADDGNLALAESSVDVAGSAMAAQYFQALPASDRQALTLTKVVGFSMAEAATRLGISEGAMKTRVHRAIRRFKRVIDAEQVDP